MVYRLERPSITVASPGKKHIIVNLKSESSNQFSYVGYKISKYDIESGDIKISPKILYQDLSNPPLLKEQVVEDFKQLVENENLLNKTMFFLREMEKLKEVQNKNDIIFLEEDTSELYLGNIPKIRLKTTKTDQDTVFELNAHRENILKAIPPNIFHIKNKKVDNFHLTLFLDKNFEKNECQRILSSILCCCNSNTRSLLAF